jgi:hypothetical protein
MVLMAHWAVIIPADRWATERLFQNDTLRVAVAPGPAVGDEVLLVAGGDEPRAVALGLVQDRPGGGDLLVAYTRRAFDEPVPVDDLKLGPDESVAAVDPAVFRTLAARLGGDHDRQAWLVSVALPIEAINPAEAVRQFWSHVRELGPAELPTYVSPSGDELAMQAFVLGAEANQDPEEEDED